MDRPEVIVPSAPREPVETTVHGDTRVDDYAWLRNREDPRVREYLETENAFTDAMTAHTKNLQESLYREILGHIEETDVVPIARIDDYEYLYRTEEGKEYAIHSRRRADGPEEVLLDHNELARGHPYFALGHFELREDHRLLIYSEDTTGEESYTLRVKDLDTGELLPDAIRGTYYSAAWTEDGGSFLYAVHDEAMRPYRLCLHVLGTDPSEDVVVYEEPDDHFHLGVYKSRSRRYLILKLASAVTTEIRYAPASDPGDFRVFAERRHGVEYDVEHQGDRFLVRTNEDAKNFRLMEAPVDTSARGSWREVLPGRADVTLEHVDAFADHLVLFEREHGVTRLRVRKMSTGEEHHVDLPEPVYMVWPAWNAMYDTNVYRFQYSSLVTPRSIFDYDLDSRERSLVKQTKVPGYDLSLYETERLWATAPDGASVPVSIVHRKGIARDGSNPCWLYAYGSYGAATEPGFSAERISILDRGYVYALAHVRGGGDLGETWRDAGKLLEKRNTFTDLVACAEHLVDAGYTSAGRIALKGVSAGGLMVGAVLNERPELFGAAIADVPFVDVLNTILDPSLPLTVMEWDEWGNPVESEEHYRYIKGYSPYDNVDGTEFPPLLVIAGLNDPRVHYWEPAKWVAKLRAHKPGSQKILLRTHMDTGHGGPSGRYESFRETAFEQAFVFDVLGVADATS